MCLLIAEFRWNYCSCSNQEISERVTGLLKICYKMFLGWLFLTNLDAALSYIFGIKTNEIVKKYVSNITAEC